MAHRRAQALLLALAVVGLGADLATKYGVFRWLYNDRQPIRDDRFESWMTAERWTKDGPQFIAGGRYDVLPGWFGLIAEYKVDTATNDWRKSLQSYSAPLLPRVNEGALFGLGGEYGREANATYAAVSGLAALGILIWVFWPGRQIAWWVAVALGLILGGTLGNFYDRVVFFGVRDFLYFYIIDWPVFNVADCSLVCGASMLVLHALFVKPPAPPPPPSALPAPPPTPS